MRSLSILLLLIVAACNYQNDQAGNTEENPPSPGFNLEGSDAEAMALADEVMTAMGGRTAWDTTRIIKWNFFGRRDLLWNKETGQVRIDSPRDSLCYLLNIQSMEGKVFKDMEEVTDSTMVKQLIERGKAIWINDSYWLCMPFKLKDSGVTLKYAREDTTQTGIQADVLQMTFNEVGVTPQNKYEVWVDKSDHLIKQWAYFRDASQDSASAIWPFDNYQRYGSILLSADRSDGRGPKAVKVYQEINDSLFTDPSPILWND